MAQATDEQDAWECSSGYVYFIAAGEPAAAIKIGITKESQFRRRFSAIQGCNHEPLRVLGVIPFTEGERPMQAALLAESDLHGRFRHLQRFKPGWVGSEWFTAASELIAFIEKNTVNPGELGLADVVAQIGPGIESTRDPEGVLDALGS